MKPTLVLVALLTLAASAAASRQAPAIADLAWMAGSWAGVSGGVEMEEQWTAPKGGTMLGVHRDVAKGRTVAFEFLRIEQQGDAIVYLAMPGGRSPATPFPLKEIGAERVVFENPGHDFPQRVIYWKDGADLRARIEGMRNGKAAGMEWRWSPAR